MSEMTNVAETTKRKEIKVMASFSIEPSFKAELDEYFAANGLGWGAGVRFALRQFMKQHRED